MNTRVTRCGEQLKKRFSETDTAPEKTICACCSVSLSNLAVTAHLQARGAAVADKWNAICSIILHSQRKLTVTVLYIT